MKHKLRNHVDGIFADTVPTRRAVELKEEMIQYLEDKYTDLISEGKTEEAAYNIALSGIGNITSLLSELDSDTNASLWRRQEDEAARKKSAMLTSIAVMLYILSVLPLIVISMVIPGRLGPMVGLPILIVMCAIATGILIYNSMSKPQFHKESDTMVEEFKEWQAETHDRRQMRKAISSALWTVIVAVYFIISFTTHAWHMTWIIFIIGGAIESFIEIFTSPKKKG
jgi:hypothetical protein